MYAGLHAYTATCIVLLSYHEYLQEDNAKLVTENISALLRDALDDAGLPVSTILDALVRTGKLLSHVTC